MKKFYPTLFFVFISLSLWAQSPEKMSYQAVIRDASDNLVISTSVGMQISILQGSTNGTPVYVEIQTPTTNANGLISIEIGNGTVQSGDFSTIDWANETYFIKTETDPTGSTSYSITGTSQLLSVPYALHAKTAETFTGTITETDPTYTAWDKSTGISITESQISDLNHFTTADETDPSVPTGTQTGEMQYWNGTAWVTIAAGTTGQKLSNVNGVPIWIDGDAMVDPVSGQIWKDVFSLTGEIWMDRNLGALQVATSSDDAAAYGDLYQWGRAADGHESRTSGTTSTLSSNDTPGHGDFITNASSPYDWRSTQNNNLWQGVSGTNNPCPNGYRVPTEAEWAAERASWSSDNTAGAFASPLKLTIAGYRDLFSGMLNYVGHTSLYWSSTVDGADSRYLYFFWSHSNINSGGRADGISVRCIKD